MDLSVGTLTINYITSLFLCKLMMMIGESTNLCLKAINQI